MDETVRRLAKQVDSRKYGKYRGFVTDNEDPDQRGRLRAKVPSVMGEEETDWAVPCLPFGGVADQGFFVIPEAGAHVWIEFEEGDVHRPIWTGTLWPASGDAPEEAKVTPPTVRVWKTPSGHRIQFDDTEDEEELRLHHSTGAELAIDKNGTVTLVDADQNQLILDAENGKIILEDPNGNNLVMTSAGTTLEDSNGNKIDLSASGVVVKGPKIVLDGQSILLGGEGGEPIIKGTSFITLFMTHVHPTAVGPSGPPIPQGETSALSTKVQTS